MFPASYYSGAEAEEEDQNSVPASPKTPQQTKGGSAKTMSELRLRLQAKVQELSHGRAGKEDDDDNLTSNKKGSRRKKRKRDGQETQQGQPQKSKLQDESLGKDKTKKLKPSKLQGKNSNGAVNAGGSPTSAKKKSKKHKHKTTEGQNPLTPPKSNTSAPSTAPNTPTNAKKQKPQELPVPVDYQFGVISHPDGDDKKKVTPKQALKQIVELEQKIHQLKKEDIVKLSETTRLTGLATALQRAQGGKVHDDKARIQKAIKKKEKSKLKSKREWKEREKKVGKLQANAQSKRQENINAKIQKKKALKLKRSIKKRGDFKALLGES